MLLTKQIFKNSKTYIEIFDAYNNKMHHLNVNGVSESLASMIISDMHNHSSRNAVVIVSTESQARRIYEEIKENSQSEVLFFPKKELMMSHIFTESKDMLWERVSSINKIVFDKKDMIIVSSIEALMYRLMNFNQWKEYYIPLDTGKEIAFENLKEKIVEMGFERVELTETPGHFSVRGGILDIYPPDFEHPARIEFFGDEVDSIRIFDESTQKSIEKRASIILTPAVEGCFSQNDLNELYKNLLLEGKQTFIDDVQSGLYREHLDQLLPYMDHQIFTIIDYLENPSLIFMDLDKVMDRYDHIREDFIERFKNLLERKEVLPRQSEIIVEKDYLHNKMNKLQVINLNSFNSFDENLQYDEIVSFKMGTVDEYFGKLDMLIKDLKDFKYRGYRVFLVIHDEEKFDLISKVAHENDFIFDYRNKIEGDLMTSQVALVKGFLETGFVLLPTKTIVLTEKEIFGTRKRRKIKKFNENSKMIRSFRELKDGDYVVHEGHGIGKYIGIRQVEVDNIKKDYLTIQYMNDEFLYIPIEQMQLIQKYVGGDVEKIKVNRLGTGEWQKTKARARKAVEDMTDELIRLYSERMSKKGHQFSEDTDWQREFESLFPYEETNDQLKSVQEIKNDMQESVPMDRLLCGDVGYGKTEVALRAAFKAIADSKQVAILVPTTILAQQHYNTIVERFSKYPIKVEMLSRFRSKKEQEVIINQARKGMIDIIVGTHRMLSSDVVFKDLGLLIVDEEQRFGVRHKEKIKSLKVNVDVLTLTATPIPRTLHMSMMGVRDLSIIEDPPEDRYPIQTYVMDYKENIVREAIIREMDRGGQVFFVYNIVKDIDSMTDKIRKLVPEARIEYAHGQMSEGKLSKVILSFLNKEIDVLVATTIIETGLDISNVNTIIIYNADKMGLSQLYQLRGRVGRSNRVAYAYLTYEKNKVLSEVAQKRLLAIKEFTELGSGFKIALRDLEIRGAGNLLGSQQHGHMEAIGYELYIKLIEEKMKEIKGVEKEISVETSLEIAVDSYIPDTYIEDVAQKLEIYKKISSIETKEDMHSIEEEIEDRFGDIPLTVYNLLTISHIRALASKIPFSNIKESEKGFVLELDKGYPLLPETIVKISLEYPRDIKINAGNKPYILFYYKNKNDKLRNKLIQLESFLEKIISLNN
ncbi:MAG: transcription-repair coupling factor [Clostridiales bacterium]|nr:transcription-repair coupling factor [Clostridiales bacterium]